VERARDGGGTEGQFGDGTAHLEETQTATAPRRVVQVQQRSTAAIKHADALSFYASVILGLGLLFYASRQLVLRSRVAARQPLKATIAYLLLQMLVLMVAKG
jgi:hypothetical protein